MELAKRRAPRRERFRADEDICSFATYRLRRERRFLRGEPVVDLRPFGASPKDSRRVGFAFDLAPHSIYDRFGPDWEAEGVLRWDGWCGGRSQAV